jgi:hypothetical protein
MEFPFCITKYKNETNIMNEIARRVMARVLGPRLRYNDIVLGNIVAIAVKDSSLRVTC